jgi:DNA-binding sugar fermentation-stimulating protein
MPPLYQFPKPFIGATVVARPSRQNKSPYLLDCRLDDGSEAIVHNPALSCNGLIDPGAKVWLQPAASDKSLSTYVLYLVDLEGTLVCVHPTVANEVCLGLIRCGRVAPFIEKVRREVTFADSAITDCRFDFYGLTDDKPTYIEVKSASMADTVNCLPRDRAKATHGPLMAIFPYGNRPKLGLVSERALKHVEGLKAAVAAGHLGWLVYISMRTDVTALKVSVLDPVYRQAVMSASGVRVVAFSVAWRLDGSCHFEKKLDVI